MSATSGLSFYLSEAVSTAPQSLTYGFEVLSVDDLSVVGINTSNQRVSLVKDSDFTLNLDTKTVTCTSSAWSGLTKISQLSDSGTKIRIFRTTSVVPAIDFKSGAVLSEGDLDTAFKQGLFAAQEINEDASATGTGTQSVTSGMITDNAVTTAKIAGGAVTAFELAASSVDGSKLQNNTVIEGKIANNAVTNLKIANDSITTAKIFNGQVTTAKIADDAVTQAKVAKASKANMEGQSATDGVVTPDVLKHSPFAPKCYGTVAYSSGSAALAAGSYNVASASASGDQRTITFTDGMDDNNYVVFANMETSGAMGDNHSVTVMAKTTAGFTIESQANVASTTSINFIVFGSTFA